MSNYILVVDEKDFLGHIVAASRIEDVAQAQDAAFDEAGTREVEAMFS